MGIPTDNDKFRACRGLLLDFGGTLDTDGDHWLDRFYDLYESAGIDVPRPDIKRVFYYADDTLYGDPQVFSLGLRPLMRRHVKLQFEALDMKNAAWEEHLIDGFCSRTEFFLHRNVSLLDRLKDRYRLGVVSNFYGNVAALCEEAGIARFFDVILDSARVGRMKPDPAIFHMAVEALRVEPEETIFVGDSYERDMMPARKAGMKTVWMKGPNPRIPHNPEPVDCCITSLGELGTLLL